MRIIFAGTPEFAVPSLQALIDHAAIDVVAVYTQPDRRAGRGKKMTAPPVKQLAVKHHIPVLQPQTLSDQASTIAELKPAVMVVVAYGMLLPQSILDLPQYACLNIHASLLPRWRGAAPIQRAIEAGDQETGVSIMQMALGLDTGPVFQRLSLPIESQDTSATLHDKLSELGASGIIATLQAIIDCNPEPHTSNLPRAEPQDSSKANYAKKINKLAAEVDWQNSALTIHNRLRAFIPWPICQTQHTNAQGQVTRFRLWRSSVRALETLATPQTKPSSPGSVIEINQQGIVIACGNQTALQLETLQRDGGRPLPSADFLRGYTVSLGDQLHGSL